MGDFFPAGRGCGSGRLELSSFKANLFLFFSFFLFSLFLFLLFLLSFSLFFFFANMTMRTDCPTHTIHRQPTNAAETATKKSKNYHCKLYFDIPVKDDTKKVEVCLFVCLFVLKVFFLFFVSFLLPSPRTNKLGSESARLVWEEEVCGFLLLRTSVSSLQRRRKRRSDLTGSTSFSFSMSVSSLILYQQRSHCLQKLRQEDQSL